MDWLKSNLDSIESRVKAACSRCNRPLTDITLIGVTKTIDPSIVNESIQMGIRVIGENKPQEIVRKHELIKGPVAWHLIGNLQSNKVKAIIDKVDCIQSVDSLKLAQEIDKRAKSIDRIMPILIQVNIGKEEQKNGVEIEDLNEVIQELDHLSHVKVEGLMCIAPFLEDPEQVRPYFRHMKSLFEQVRKIEYNNINMRHLSMGMTHDFEVAIEEGATMIRVGTGLYGNRNY